MPVFAVARGLCGLWPVACGVGWRRPVGGWPSLRGEPPFVTCWRTNAKKKAGDRSRGTARASQGKTT